MKKLHLEPTRNTPMVLFDPLANTFVISGNSMPENAVGFYDQVLEWLVQHLPQLSGETRWVFRLVYFNTSSMKGIYQVLATIKADMDKGGRHQLVWDVVDDDEFMRETGQTFQDLLRITFTFREWSQEEADMGFERILQD